MQTISSQFNRLYHALLNEAFTKARQISFRDWKCDQTDGCLIFYKHEDYSDMDDLKQIFKLMNLDYEVDGDEKISTTKVDNKQLVRHIDWITKILNENGIEFNHDIEKWERIKKEAGF
jgi:hypothetical protein